MKFLCLGIGGLFAYDFYFYADALLFKRLDVNVWLARGAVNALVVPLLAVSAARNPQWSFDLFVSRKIVFHTTSLVAAGI
ncbi:MAG: PEP-CTERM system histidine kinase PrsK, partial [Chromatiaceae bacterium]